MNKRKNLFVGFVVFGMALALLFAGCTPIGGTLDEVRDKAWEENGGGGGTTYNISITPTGDVKSGDSVTATPVTAKHGDTITLNYTIANIEQFNWIEFGGVNTPIGIAEGAGPGSTTYILSAGDAVDGIITITAKFSHLDKRPDPISFENTTGTISMIYGDSPAVVIPGTPPKLIFTNIIATVPNGTKAISYSNPVIEQTVATVDSGTGVVTILKIGSTTITATKAADETYAEATASYTLTITIASPGAPAVPGVASSSANSIVLSPPANPNPLFALEYGYSENAEVPSLWQTELTFDGLTANKYYFFFARYKNDPGKNNVSAPSGYLPVQTNNLTGRTIEFTNASETRTYGDATTLTNAIKTGYPGGGTITYLSENTSVATVNSGGQVTILKAGSAIIKATIPSDGTYAAYTAQYTLTVNKRPVTITGVTVQPKTYDGTTSATVNTLSGSISNRFGTDVVTIIYGNAVFNSKNAGTTVAVTYSNFNIGGTHVENYDLSAQPTGSGTISAKSVTITGIGAENKPYDGGISATVSGAAVIDGNLDGSNLTVTSGTAKFTSSAVGDNITVDFTGFGLGGSASSNYTLSGQPASVKANITQKTLTISVGNASKTLIPFSSATDTLYGTTATITVTVSGLAGSETLSFNFTPSNGLTLSNNTGIGNTAGHNLTLTYDGTLQGVTAPSSITLTIPSSANYSFTASHNVSVDIRDGQVEGRAIPVNHNNYQSFYTYANTTAGLTRCYKLLETISLPSEMNNWEPIGKPNAGIDTYSFKGSFDGGGNIISGIILDKTDENAGVFGYIGSGGTVKNLLIRNFFITGNSNVRYVYCGGIAGRNDGTVDSCSIVKDSNSTASITGASGSTGGIVGYNNNIVRNCSVKGTHVRSISDYVGGIVGENYGTVSNCSTEADVSCSFTMPVGGVVGYNIGGTVRNCYSTGKVSGNGRTGGVVGDNTGLVEYCYATGEISGSGSPMVGGVVGSSRNGIVRNCVAMSQTIKTSLATNIGRVIGVNTDGTMNNNYANSSMTVTLGSGTYTVSDGKATKDGEGVDSLKYSEQSWWSSPTSSTPGSGGPGFSFNGNDTGPWVMTGILPKLYWE